MDNHNVIQNLNYGNDVYALTSFKNGESYYLVALGVGGKIQFLKEGVICVCLLILSNSLHIGT